jgi:hypothetical protein
LARSARTKASRSAAGARRRVDFILRLRCRPAAGVSRDETAATGALDTKAGSSRITATNRFNVSPPLSRSLACRLATASPFKVGAVQLKRRRGHVAPLQPTVRWATSLRVVFLIPVAIGVL